MLDFKSSNRLKSKQDFDVVFRKGKRISHKYLSIIYVSNRFSQPRLGIVVKKIYFKQAVVRNKLRRVVRESFRHHKDRLKGLDIIVLLRSECIPLDNKTLRSDIDKLWQQVVSKPS